MVPATHYNVYTTITRNVPITKKYPRVAAKLISFRSTFPVLLVANKVDLDHLRAVTTEEGKQMAERLGLTYIETSAKDPPLNVDLAFHEVGYFII